MMTSPLRILFISHAYVVGVNQGKLNAIAQTGKAEVGLLAPNNWKALEWNRLLPLETPYPNIKTYSAPVLFPGRSLAERLTDLKFSIVVSHAHYLLARLRNRPKIERQQAHQQLLAHPEFNAQFCSSAPQKWLLQWGEYLPNALFAALFEQVYGSGKLKRLVRGLLNKRHTASYAR